ncbi:hypothetical protein P7C71_g4427, partial [Lecanoromycetidae sp. Uapishka_2]
MRDPLPAPIALVQAGQPLARTLSLRTLPLHVHEILPAFGIYTFLYKYVSPPISRRLFPETYASLSRKTRVNWDVHAVSLFQSCFINVAALSVIYLDKERWKMGPRERVWGYTGATGMVQGLSAGYFLWDLMMSAKDMDLYGPGALVHAASSLAVTLLGFRPFCNYYGLNFILYELSTPFLNIHWLMDKLRLTGSRAQLVNGIMLIATFGCSRLLWGTYQSVRMYQDIWTAFNTPGGLPVPPWLATAYVVSNTTLSVLNVYWFGRMITTLRKRFKKPTQADNTKEP